MSVIEGSHRQEFLELVYQGQDDDDWAVFTIPGGVYQGEGRILIEGDKLEEQQITVKLPIARELADQGQPVGLIVDSLEHGLKLWRIGAHL